MVCQRSLNGECYVHEVNMKVACVDKSASDRVILQRLIDDAFREYRNVLGHISLLQLLPATKDEVLVSSPPDVIVVGPAFLIEESYVICRDLHQAYPLVPLVVFFANDRFNLRTLRRFERVSTEAFSIDEPPIRIVHKLSSYEGSGSQRKVGKLCTVTGVKGGVGATSLVAGLAHAAQALGKRAVVMDLSPANVFAFYMCAPRWHSPEYAGLISDGIIPDQTIVERCLATSPNGITMLLPPSGGTDIRELWIRDQSRFEISLSILDVLKSIFDLVLVDIASAEGVLPFALVCRADSRLLVTSNDPASVHLLNRNLSALVSAPGDGQVRIIINMLIERGLTCDDVLDFLCCNSAYTDEIGRVSSLPFDRHARNWIGTGNSFFTEGSAGIQTLLEDTLRLLLGGSEVDTPRESGKRVGLFGAFRLGLGKREPRRVDAGPKALPVPALQAEPHAHITPVLRPVAETKGEESMEPLRAAEMQRHVSAALVEPALKKPALKRAVQEERASEDEFFEAPQLVVNE